MSIKDNNNFFVSIIVPTYNHEKFIGDCIKSVLDQSYNHWEMIVIDDNSKDKTVEIVQRFIKIDQRIRLIKHQKNYGIYNLADTYNEALEISHGELIAILEGDDLWVNNKLENQIHFFRNEEIVLSYGNRILIDEQKNIIGYTNLHLMEKDKGVLNNDPIGKKYFHYLNCRNHTPSETVVIRKNALKKIGGFQKIENCPTIDFPTWFALAGMGKFAYTQSYLGYFRRHPHASSIGKELEYCNAYMALTKKYFLDFKEIWRSIGISVENILVNQKNICTRRKKLKEIKECFLNGQWIEGRKRIVKYSAIGHSKDSIILKLILILQYILSFFHLNIVQSKINI